MKITGGREQDGQKTGRVSTPRTKSYYVKMKKEVWGGLGKRGMVLTAGGARPGKVYLIGFYGRRAQNAYQENEARGVQGLKEKTTNPKAAAAYLLENITKKRSQGRSEGSIVLCVSALGGEER